MKTEHHRRWSVIRVTYVASLMNWNILDFFSKISSLIFTVFFNNAYFFAFQKYSDITLDDFFQYQNPITELEISPFLTIVSCFWQFLFIFQCLFQICFCIFQLLTIVWIVDTFSNFRTSLYFQKLHSQNSWFSFFKRKTLFSK